MQEQSLYAYIWLGTCIRYLIDAQKGVPYHDFDDDEDGHVLYNLRRLKEMLVEHDLPVSETHFRMHGLADFVSELEANIEDSGDDASGYLELAPDEARRLRAMAASLRSTLDAEAATSVAYVARDRRHTAKTLLHDMPTLLAQGAFDDLPEVARYDFCEAGRAIAFDLPTAAGFHLMRSTEAALRQYYERLVKRNRLSRPMWGPMVEALRGKKQKPPPGHLLDHLDTIRKNFRNPTQHPEKIYDLEEAQDLLGLAADAISRMYRDAQERGMA